MHPKEADAMANSVDPDQTASSEAVWSWSALFAETYLSQYIEFLRYSNSKSTWTVRTDQHLFRIEGFAVPSAGNGYFNTWESH